MDHLSFREELHAIEAVITGQGIGIFNDVLRVLADINADHGDCGIGCLRHGVLLVFGAPCQLRLLAGQEHGRTIPLADMGHPANLAK